jgi:hypothetical protein
MEGALLASEIETLCQLYDKTLEDFELVLVLENAIQGGIQGIRKQKEQTKPGAKK